MNLLQEACKLALADRIALVEDIWDTIAIDSAELVPTAEQAELLAERLAMHRHHPEEGESWEVVVERLRQQCR